MGDSDDDYDRRKGRDKFKQERRDFESGGSRSRQQSDRSPPPQGGGGGGGGYGAPRRQYHHSSSSRNDYYYHERPGGGGGGGSSGGYDAGPPYKRPRRDDAPPPPPAPPQGADGDGGWVSGGGRSQQGRYNYQRDQGPPPPLMPPPGSAASAPAPAPPPPHLMQQPPPVQQQQQSQHAASNTLKTFKQFLLEQDDGITEQEALTRYRSYKEEFVRRQLAEFFDAHKSEEWFKEKYHPDYYEDNQRRCRDNVNRRLRAFEKLQSLGLLDGRVVHIDQAKELVRFMDTLVILLEGGCSEDFEILDAQPESTAEADDADIEEGEEKQEKRFTKPTPAPPVASAAAPVASTEAKKSAPADAADTVGGGDVAGKSTKSKKSRRKAAAEDKEKEDGSSSSSSSSSNNSSSSSSESSDSSDSSDNSDNSDAEGEAKDGEKKSKSSKSAAGDGAGAQLPVSVQGYSSTPPVEEATAKSGSSATAAETAGTAAAADGGAGSGTAEEAGELDAAAASPSAEAPAAAAAAATTTAPSSSSTVVATVKQPAKQEKDQEVEQGELRLPRRPRPLHRTQSIFLRNLHPSITRSEVETLCKAYPGFMRLALQDPAPERKFFRRGWITFQHEVNIKEICWNLNNIRLKDCDLGAIVNRELSQRVRPIMTVANHRTVMRQDIRLAARIVQQLDGKCGLYAAAAANGGRASPKQQPMLMPQLPADIAGVTVVAASGSAVVGGASANPLLKNLAEFIVDEGSYEEEALLGGASFDSHSTGDTEVKIEIEAALQAKLDRLIFYLRAVHSVDFYSATEYPNEDDMPHRCGIMHARGAVTMPDKPILQREVDNYMHEFEAKVQCLTQYVNPIVSEDAKKLGLRDEDAAVDKFLLDNTKELGQDKWLCPLSGKKFKGPEFIKKHIFNKHQSAVDNVRKDVQYFNNYIKDPKRPHVADQSQLPQQQQQQPQYMQQQQRMGYQPRGGRDFEFGGGHYGGGGYNRYDPGRRPDFYGGGYPQQQQQQQQREYGGARGGYYNDNGPRYGGGGYVPRGGYRGGGGPGSEGRPPMRPMPPGGRKLITYTDLDAPEDF